MKNANGKSVHGFFYPKSVNEGSIGQEYRIGNVTSKWYTKVYTGKWLTDGPKCLLLKEVKRIFVIKNEAECIQKCTTLKIVVFIFAVYTKNNLSGYAMKNSPQRLKGTFGFGNDIKGHFNMILCFQL